MQVQPRAASHGMPKRYELPDDDDAIRWPLIAVALAAVGAAALLLFGVGELFARDPRPGDRGVGVSSASADGQRAASPVRHHARAPGPQGPLAHTAPQTSDEVVGVLDPALAGAPDDGPDPQLERSMATTGGLDGGVGSFGMVARRGHVATVQGDSPVHPGATCDVRVLPVASGGFNCLVRVICDGELLYPNPDQSAGYVSCEVDATGPRYASDTLQTDVDGDPRLTFDGPAQQVLVGDSGDGMHDYLATITLDLPRVYRRL